MNIRKLIYPIILALGVLPLTANSEDDTTMKFQLLDNDGDGFISRSEATANNQLRESWNNVDKDKDGKLTQQEFTAFSTTPKYPYPE